MNAAALLHYQFRSQEKVFLPAAIPICGLLVSAFIWLHLSHSAQWLGVSWIAVGLGIYALMRRRRATTSVDIV